MQKRETNAETHILLSVIASFVLLLPSSAGAEPPVGEPGMLQSRIAELEEQVLDIKMDLDDLALAFEGSRVFSSVSAEDLVSTTSSLYANVPDMSLAVITLTEGPVVIRFCGESNTDGTLGSMRFKAQLDGVDVNPTEIQASGNDLRLPRCFQWVAQDVAPGAHVFSILWRTFSDQAFVQGRVLTVEAR